jgi:hypothetical protein
MSSGASTAARLLVEELPEWGAGVKRFTVDCRWSTTTALYLPGRLGLQERHVISVALQRHEDEYRRCNLAPLWAEHGDAHLKALVEAAWEEYGALALKGRRN